MRRAIFAFFLRGMFLRELNRFLRDFRFREPALTCEGFNRMAIEIAGREIHVGVNVGRIGPQRLFDHAQGLEEFLPIDRALLFVATQLKRVRTSAL